MKTKALVVGGISALALLLAGVTVANAETNSTSSAANNLWRKIKNKVQEVRVEKQDKQNNLANLDYDSWKKDVDEREKVFQDWYNSHIVITKYINKDNYSRFVEMQNLLRQGKKDEADKIRQELGLPDTFNKGMFMGQGRKIGHFMRKGLGQRSSDGSIGSTTSQN